MSGIEILGIAASVLQIADLGGKLSVKLFTFSRKVKNAHKSIDDISQDIAATGAVLQQLGFELQRDQQLRLCSQEAVSTTKKLVQECNKIFIELNNALDGGKSQTQGSRLVLGWKDRLKFSFLEPQVDLLRSNLERLKGSLAVMLNVMIFAEQMRNQEALPILKEQRELIRVLVEDKEKTQKRFERALRTIGDAAAGDSLPQLAPQTQLSREIPNPTVGDSPLVASGLLQDQKPGDVEPVLVPPLPVGILRWKEEIEHHSALVKRLLDEASAPDYNIDHAQRHRMHEGILHVHWEEWSRLRKMYNHDVLLRAFSSRHPVSRFWQLQLEREILWFKHEDRDTYAESLPEYPGLPIMQDTSNSSAQFGKPPIPLPPIPGPSQIQHVHIPTQGGQQLPPAPSPTSAGHATTGPEFRSDVPFSPHPERDYSDDDSDDDSTDALFQFPLSNKPSTIPSDGTSSSSRQVPNLGSSTKEVRCETFISPSMRLPPPAPRAARLESPLERPFILSRTRMGAPARPRVDFNFQRASPSNEQQLNAEKQAKEDIATRFTNIKFDKEDEEEKEIHPSRRARGTAAVPDKVDQHTLSPARHQLKEAGDGDGLDGKVLVKSQELTEEMRHLDLLARVTGDELEAQNQHAVKINMKDEHLDGGGKAEVDVVDDLLLRWTNLSKCELGQTGQD